MERGRNQVRLLILSDTSPQYFFSRRKRFSEEAAMKLTTSMMTLMRMENGNNDGDGNGDADGAIVGS